MATAVASVQIYVIQILYIYSMKRNRQSLSYFLRPPPPGSLPQNFPEILGQETFYLLSSPSPNFPGNFGAGDIWRLFDAFFAPKFSGNFGTGDAASRDYTRPEISWTFWDGPSQNFQEFLERIFSLSRVKFLGNFVHTKFSEKFGTGALGVKFLGNFVHTKLPEKFGTGALGLYSEIFRKFWGPKFPGNFAVGSIWQLFAVFFVSKILRECWDEKRVFARLHETSNFWDILERSI